MGAKLSAHVERQLDESDTFQRAVKQTFSKFAGSPDKAGGGGDGEVASKPDVHSTSPGGLDGMDAGWVGVEVQESCLPGVQQAQLLESAKYLVKCLEESINKTVWTVCLRDPTKRDVDFVIFSDPSLHNPGGVSPTKPLHYKDFERFQRGILKRVTIDRGRRLLMFMGGGLLAVHLVKRTVRQLPFVGGPVVALVNAILPTPLLGPAVGVAGALYVDNATSTKTPKT